MDTNTPHTMRSEKKRMLNMASGVLLLTSFAGIVALVGMLAFFHFHQQYVTRYLDAGLDAEEKGEYDKAIKLYRLSVNEKYESDGIGLCGYDSLARALFINRDSGEALEVFRAKYKSRPDIKKHSSLSRKADGLLEKNDYIGYLEICDRMIEMASGFSGYCSPGIEVSATGYYANSCEGYVRKYNILQDLGKNEKALQVHDEFLKIYAKTFAPDI